MKLRALLSLLLLASAALVAVPTAAADHCAEKPLVDEVRCEANHVDTGTGVVKCIYNTPPSEWDPKCIAPL